MSERSGTEVYFYHLERRTLDRCAADPARAVAQARLARRGAGGERGARRGADTLLWTYREESFLPHGTARDGRAAAHPIYLTAGDDNPNAAQVRFLVDGATLADASPYARVVFIFDGRDADAVARARAKWQAAKARGMPSAIGSRTPTGAGSRRRESGSNCQSRPAEGAL